jgi:hypothetical protein
MKSQKSTKHLSQGDRDALFTILRTRFQKQIQRHPGLDWALVEQRLTAAPDKLWPLHEMELTGGEPDVVAVDQQFGEVLFMDCSEETPKSRISLCYDREGLESRKDHPPKGTAMEMAAAMGIELLTEPEYFDLQTIGSSWLKTPADIRKLGGALFGDRRFGRVFIYHNGAQSYYAARGFRGCLRV